MKKNQPSDIWKRIGKGGDEECWPYLGSTFSGRYGRFFLNGKAVCAHRIVYEIKNGDIPPGLFVMHKCNNKICCNPLHLTVGTNSENQRHAIFSKAFKSGASGIPGVGYVKDRGYWRANGYEMGRLRNLYTGPSFEKAVAARSKWEKEYAVQFNQKETK